MTKPTSVSFRDTDIEILASHTGRIAVLIDPEGRLDRAARRINKLTRGALQRAVDSDGFGDLKPGQVMTLAYPAGLEARAVDILRLPKNASVEIARKGGAALGQLRGKADLLLAAGNTRRVADVTLGAVVRDYSFGDHKTDAKAPEGSVTVMCAKPDEVEAEAGPLLAVAEGVEKNMATLAVALTSATHPSVCRSSIHAENARSVALAPIYQ